MCYRGVALVLGALLSTACGLLLGPQDINDQLLPSYDYIIVGARVAGVVVANRLTENPNGMCLSSDHS